MKIFSWLTFIVEVVCAILIMVFGLEAGTISTIAVGIMIIVMASNCFICNRWITFQKEEDAKKTKQNAE